MRRKERLATKKRRRRLLVALPVAIVLIAASAVIGSGAVFTATSANPSNVFTAGNLKHTNSEDGAAILTADKMKPGDTAQGTVTITNDGDLDGTFSVTGGTPDDEPGDNGGNLSEVLTLVIIDQTGPTTIYTGDIDGVSGVAAGDIAVGASRTYEFTVTFPDGGTPTGPTTDDNAYKASSMEIQFDWNQVQ